MLYRIFCVICILCEIEIEKYAREANLWHEEACEGTPAWEDGERGVMPCRGNCGKRGLRLRLP